MKRILIVVALALGLAASADAQISFGIGIRESGVSIGINFSSYPRLVPVPGYPVYYYPEANSNYFFYDGLYWVYQDDNWYASSWYNGPWDLIDPYYVPEFVLRIPVRYYRRPPVYFRGWRADAPPRWDEHWGRDWNARRSGWDQWDRRSAPRPAPLPSYQRQYSGDRYPRAPEQQRSIRSEKYRYEPRDSVTRQYWQQQQTQRPQAQQQPQRQPPPAQQQPQRQPPPAQQQPQRQPPAAQQQPQRQRPAAQQQPQRQPPAAQRQPQRQPPAAQQQPQRPQAQPQGKGREGAPATQEKGRQKDAGPGGRSRDNKDEEHDQGPR